MNGHVRTNRWAVFFGAALLAALVGILAYNAGFSHGLVQSGQLAGDPGAFRRMGGTVPGEWDSSSRSCFSDCGSSR